MRVAKQLNEVYFCILQVPQSQNTEHAKVLSYFTNKWKTRFDYRRSLNKNILYIKYIFFD